MLPHNITNINKGALVFSLLKEIPLTIYNGDSCVFKLDYSDGFLDYYLDIALFKDIYSLVESGNLLWSYAQFRTMCRDFIDIFVELSEYFDLLIKPLIINYSDIMYFGPLVILSKREMLREGELLSKSFSGRLVHMTLIQLLSKQMDSTV